jgi:hypothetical protein
MHESNLFKSTILSFEWKDKCINHWLFNKSGSIEMVISCLMVITMFSKSEKIVVDVAQVSLPLHKFMHQPHCYYSL